MNKLVRLCLYAFLHISCLKLSLGKDEVPLVRVKQGLIQGIKEESLNGKEFYSYMSIPFAKPPVKDLRFKDPVPVDPWNSVLDGTKVIVECLQIDIFAALFQKSKHTINIQGREDCLHLNVYTRAPDEPERKLPVMVFIHGGGFMFGGAQQYPPYVLMNRDIVLVVIQYRLGIFGFLSTEDSVLPGNMGLKDQQLALKWVKENIQAFGGDPERITIFGESAGGASVNYQILSPGSKGLFNGAIMQSGAVTCPWSSSENHRQLAVEKGREFNCSIESGSEEFLECMQNVNHYYLALTGAPKQSGLYDMHVLPRVDGEFIDEDPEILMKRRKYNKVNIISGVTRDDGAMFLMMDQKPKEDKEFKQIVSMLFLEIDNEENHSELAKQIFKYYFKREDTLITEKDRDAIVELATDRHFKVCHDKVSNIFASDEDVKFYSYQLDHFGEVSILNVPGFNRSNYISHMDDLTYLFSGGIFAHLKKMEDENDLRLRELMLDLWTSFAETGNPSSSEFDFNWREATNSNFKYLSLKPSPIMKNDYFQETRKFWSSLKTKQNLKMQKVVREEL